MITRARRPDPALNAAIAPSSTRFNIFDHDGLRAPPDLDHSFHAIVITDSTAS
jgi:hypothetical protein